MNESTMNPISSVTSRTLKSLLVVGLTAGLFGCLGVSDPGSTATAPKGKLSLKFNARAKSLAKRSALDSPIGAISAVDKGGTRFSITEAKLNVFKIEIDKEDPCDGNPLAPVPGCASSLDSSGKGKASADMNGGEESNDKETVIHGPFNVDLVTGTTAPQIPAIDASAGAYHLLKLKCDVDKDDNNGANDADLNGQTLVVKGTFEYGGKSDRKFSFSLKFEDEIRASLPVGVKVDADKQNSMKVVFDVAKWFQGMDLKAMLDSGVMSLDADGNLTFVDIGANESSGLEQAMNKGLNESGDAENDSQN